uniref:hypothetical protein n=1 Tax=Cupriavidus gilardii TaxID=82541 RepID=UPI0024785037|nr:hypothetical protein [Cupriavidus gilardii]WDE72642.1 hypothetical protein [Cupriavidus gilardii]
MGEPKSRARTEREAIAQALFDDVDDLIGRLEALQHAWPASIAEAVQKIHDAGAALTAQLVEAAETESALVNRLDEAAQNAHASIAAAAKVAADEEAARVRLQLAKVVESAIEKARSQGEGPMGWRRHLAAFLTAAGGVICGVIVGAALFSNAAPTDEEKAQLAAGRDFMRIYPKLDPATKEKVAKLVAGQ